MAAMDRAAERHFAGVRLVQAAFHSRSMALYAKLGLDIREPLVVMQGPAIHEVPAGYVYIPLSPAMCRPAMPSVANPWPRSLGRIVRRCQRVDRPGWWSTTGGLPRTDRCWIFWTHCRGKQCGVAGAPRRCRCVRRAGNSGTDAQHGTLSLVPEPGSARRRADDTDDRGLV